MILDLANRRADEVREVQILYLLAVAVGVPVTSAWALLVGYILVQFSEIHGLLLVRRIFEAARDSRDMLERFVRPAIIYEWLSAATIGCALSIAMINTIPEWQIGALAIWCLATTYFVFPTIYCTMSLYGCALIQTLMMLATIFYIRMHSPMGTEAFLACVGLALFSGALAAFLGRQMRADYLAQLEREGGLAATARELDRLDMAKTQFVANLSHEIRTPLTGILGLVALLKRTRPMPEDAETIDRILGLGNELSETLESSLALSELNEAGRAIWVTEASLEDLVERNTIRFALQAHERGLKFETSFDPAIRGRLAFDRVRAEQCLMALISNAVKFSEDGVIRIDARLREEGDRPIAEIAVSDQGIGIPEDLREAVFDPFLQADQSSTRRHRGVGIGLALARRLARIMGGDIQLDGPSTGGAVFRLRFPALMA